MATMLTALLRIAGLALMVLAVFALTTAILTLPISLVREAPIGSLESLRASVICALVVWAFVALFHIKREALHLPFVDCGQFVDQVKAHLLERGYELIAETDRTLVFQPLFRSFLFGGRIKVRLQRGVARVHGPKIYLERLQNALHAEGRLEQYRASLHELQLQQDPMLQRVEIGVRVTPEQWEVIQSQVVAALVGAGAEVICDIHILAQAAEGISSQVVDDIRDALREQGIRTEVHREPKTSPRSRG